MPNYELSALETRILGCLLEMERVTPENYPLSLNALAAACNQSTAREPVASYDNHTVEEGVNSLRERKLAVAVFGAGSRVQKYRHNLLEHYNLEPREIAVLCVLMLRGPQTPGELRGRTERMFTFGSLEAVDACLEELARGDDPLVRLMPARPGQKERRYVQLFSAESATPEVSSETVIPLTARGTTGRTETWEAELEQLRQELAELRAEFASFRQQFE
jgi:uncharacterized protein YceH (UPF0502 family)